MMNEATFANRSLGKDIISSLDFALLGTPSESDSMAELDFPWTNLAKDSQFSSTQYLDHTAGEGCIASAVIGPYTPTDDEFTSGFGLKDNPAGPLTFAPRRTLEQPVDGLDPSSPSFFILENQDFDADVLPYCDKAHDAASSEPSPTSTRPEGSSASACSATPVVGQSGAPDIERQREKNRVAARKCRQKTKQNVAGLRRREKELGQQNKVLVSCVRSLREEILDLKTEILKHSNCDNVIIQKYIANAARRQIE
ncbi:hypothetical protein FHL15_001520 [Xylaria flabelliformis]|uniref:BZIP domain-containing protein n=1 Tax=Xylaria flabelliformis TaxID=2512241 RepID=A0A553IC32_9PEZI|nr:hypothetical protein FHL15_001520 [Xylaria flabelliformis]